MNGVRRPPTRVLAVLWLALPVAASAAEKKPLAGLVVRSKEYVVHRSTAGVVEELTGDVRYTHGDKEVTADWALIDRDRGTFQARGGVTAALRLKTGDTLAAQGWRAQHDANSGRGSLVSRDEASPVAVRHWESASGSENSRRMLGGIKPKSRIPDGPPTNRAVARSMEWDENASRATLRGDVHAWGPEGDARADQADYDNARGIMELSGRRPVIVRAEPKWDGAIQGDRIRADGGPACARSPRSACGRPEADGGVHGWLRFHGREPVPGL